MKKLLVSFLILTAIHPVFPQVGDAILQFNAVQVENHVQLNFTIMAGNTCNGIQIYRSADSINFAEIGDIQGVCGSTDRNESYSFSDYSPLKNKTNYYRLQLGTLGVSYITGIFFIDLSGNKALVFPNPVSGESEILFLNSSNEELQLSVFSHNRQLVYESEVSRDNSFRVNRKDYSAGIYFFEIKATGYRRYQGKFVVH